MSFTEKTWVDRVSEYPARRTLTSESGTTEVVTVERNEGTISQEGDAFSAANMNDLEGRIADAFESVDTVLDALCTLTCTCAEELVGATLTLTSEDGTTVLSEEVPSGMVVTFQVPSLGTWVLHNPVTNTDTTFNFQYFGAYTADVHYYYYYTADINFGSADPTNMVTYADDAAGMSKGRANWIDQPIFKDLKNCVLVSGEVLYYLNPDNLNKTEDGSTSDITSLGNDVMLEIPYRLGYRIEWDSDDSNILHVSVTNNPNDSNYNYDAFSLSSYNDCDKIYIGTFKGYATGSNLYSSNNKSVTVSQTIDTFRTYAHNRGTGYQQRSYASVKLMQCLYIIMYGTLDSQSAVGYGYVNSSHSAGVATGNTNQYGFCSELADESYMTDQNHQVKCLGIEDFWGNYWEFVDGVCTDSSRNVLTCQCADDFDTDGTGYDNNGNGGVTSDIGNYMSKPQGGSNAGFTAQAVGGSTTTYFCDYAYLYASCLARFGGSWYNALNAGAFLLNLDHAFSLSAASVGARLMYLHKEEA